jgi:hypothetical protein
MRAKALDPLAANLNRRQLLTRALAGSVGAATGLAAIPSEAKASGRRRVVFEVAILGHTYATILAPGATDADFTNLRVRPLLGRANSILAARSRGER